MGLRVYKIGRRQPRFTCAVCSERFADHQAHVDVLMGSGATRKAHRACAEDWLRKTRGPLLTQRIPILDGRER